MGLCVIFSHLCCSQIQEKVCCTLCEGCCTKCDYTSNYITKNITTCAQNRMHESHCRRRHHLRSATGVIFHSSKIFGQMTNGVRAGSLEYMINLSSMRRDRFVCRKSMLIEKVRLRTYIKRQKTFVPKNQNILRTDKSFLQGSRCQKRLLIGFDKLVTGCCLILCVKILNKPMKYNVLWVKFFSDRRAFFLTF